MKRTSLLFFIAFTFSVLGASTYYVDNSGSDSNQGTSPDQPLATISKAIDLSQAGDTILLRGGVYYQEKKISISKSGLPGKMIHLWAFPGEHPVLDFSMLPEGNTDRGITLGARYWYIRGLEITHAGDNGLIIDSGHFNIIERCTFRNNGDTGLQISGGSAYNEVINCDSYYNKDLTFENADGFAAKIRIGSGNRFIGCRSWNNADDGWDLYEGERKVEIHYCWAFRNGYLQDGSPAAPNGDMNGFKLGGNGVEGDHLVSHSLAFQNGSKGFDQNNNSGNITLLNNTAWMNGTYYKKPNYSFPNRQHIFKNNISFQGADEDRLSGDSETNSWNGFTVDSADFRSLDPGQATMERQQDGNLPLIDLLSLSPASEMNNAGTDVGFPFSGPAPSLGAWDSNEDGAPIEYSTIVTARSVQGYTEPASNMFIKGSTISVEAIAYKGFIFKEWSGAISSPDNPVQISTESNLFLLPIFIEDTSTVNLGRSSFKVVEMHLFPNPATNSFMLSFSNFQAGIARLSISDIAGRNYFQGDLKLVGTGRAVEVDVSEMQEGMYIVSVFLEGKQYHRKLIIQ